MNRRGFVGFRNYKTNGTALETQVMRTASSQLENNQQAQSTFQQNQYQIGTSGVAEISTNVPFLHQDPSNPMPANLGLIGNRIKT